jgi:hypothetical protein
LEEHTWNDSLLYVGFDLEPNGEPVLKANLLDIEIVPQHLQFARQRNLLVASRAQGKSQELAQARNHALCSLWIAVDQGSDGVECIEQKVRLQLKLEGLKLCLIQLHLQPFPGTGSS